MPANVTWGTKNLFDKPVPPPSEINPDVNDALDSIVLKTLSKKAADRYPTAKELLTALENWRPSTPDIPSRPKPLSSEPSKSVLGFQSPANETIAQDMAQKAFKANRAGDWPKPPT